MNLEEGHALIKKLRIAKEPNLTKRGINIKILDQIEGDISNTIKVIMKREERRSEIMFSREEEKEEHVFEIAADGEHGEHAASGDKFTRNITDDENIKRTSFKATGRPSHHFAAPTEFDLDHDRLFNLILAFLMYRPDIGYLPVIILFRLNQSL